MRSCHNKQPLQYPLFAPVLLIGAIIAVYFPAVQSGIHPYDDPGIIARYSASLPLSQSLLPGNSYYYRPLVEFSFWLDNQLWGMAPSVMHLESILLHCINSLLVYLLACKLHDKDDKNRLIPLLAALLFGLHPVNVEAVAWISGRTDPLLALFTLSATFFWLRWLNAPDWRDMSVAMALFGAALLTKETALAFGGVIAVLALAWPGTASSRQRITAVTIMAVPAVLLLGFVLIFKKGHSGLSIFISDASLPPLQSLQIALTALGFYLKKLIFPVPLDFAIQTVQPVYILAGVAFFPLAWWGLRRQRQASILFVAAALLILPAVMIAIKQVAWTPFAERYLYLPSAFFILGLIYFSSGMSFTHKKILVPATVCIIAIFAVVSLQRTTLWNDKLAFFEDAVTKSPQFGSVYYTLGGILAQNGETNRASEAFITAERLNQRDSMRHPIKAAIMGTKIVKGELLEARTYFYKTFTKKEHAPADFLELLFKADNKRLVKLDSTQKKILAADILETLNLLHKKQPDPFWLYQSAHMALIMGNQTKAADFFRRAYADAPTDSHFRGAALTYLRRLDQRN